MALPDFPLPLHGGCNCGAIRYQLAIPGKTARLPHPLLAAPNTNDSNNNNNNDENSHSSATTITMPFIAFDHCNDCRRAIGQVQLSWICMLLLDMVAFSFVDKRSTTAAAGLKMKRKQGTTVEESEEVEEEEEEEEEGEKEEKEEEKRGPRISAKDIFLVDTKGTTTTTTNPATIARAGGGLAVQENTFFHSFYSSPAVRRSFCGRCGTHLSYFHDALPEGFPLNVDIVLGSLDEGDLRRWDLTPEVHLWWGRGVEWVREMSYRGTVGVSRRIHGFDVSKPL